MSVGWRRHDGARLLAARAVLAARAARRRKPATGRRKLATQLARGVGGRNGARVQLRIAQRIAELLAESEAYETADQQQRDRWASVTA